MAIPVVTCGADIVFSYSAGTQTANLTVSATGSPTSWYWVMLSVPDGSTANVGANGNFTDGVSTTQNPSFDTTGAVEGIYVLQCTATNAEGSSNPQTGAEKDAAQQQVVVKSQNLGLYYPGDWSYNWGKKYLVPTLKLLEAASGSGSDPNAIHDNIAGEINAITAKGTPVGADLVVIEDSAAAWAKKKVAVSNFLGGGSIVEDTTADITLYINGSSGSDSNDGLTPGTSVLTWKHLQTLIPRRVHHDVTIYVDGTFSTSNSLYLVMPHVDPEKTVLIQGYDETDLVTGLTSTNRVTKAIGASTFTYGLEVLGAGWSVDAYKGKFIEIQSGLQTGKKLAVSSNTSDTIYFTPAAVNITATTSFKIYQPGNSIPGTGITRSSIDCLTSTFVDTVGNIVNPPLHLKNLNVAEISIGKTPVKLESCDLAKLHLRYCPRVYFDAVVADNGAKMYCCSNCTGMHGLFLGEQFLYVYTSNGDFEQIKGGTVAFVNSYVSEVVWWDSKYLVLRDSLIAEPGYIDLNSISGDYGALLIDSTLYCKSIKGSVFKIGVTLYGKSHISLDDSDSNITGSTGDIGINNINAEVATWANVNAGTPYVNYGENIVVRRVADILPAPSAGGGGQTDTVTGSNGITNVGDNVDANLAPTYGSSVNTICQGNDSRLSDARTPTAHASSHQSGGGDSIKLDDLSAPDDNVDLNATISAHGLLPKLGGGTTNFLRADGTWAAPTGSSLSFDEDELISTGTETSKILTNTPVVSATAPCGYALSCYRNGKRMRYQATPTTNDHFNYTPGTKTVSFLASGTNDEYQFVYWS